MRTGGWCVEASDTPAAGARRRSVVGWRAAADKRVVSRGPGGSASLLVLVLVGDVYVVVVLIVFILVVVFRFGLLRRASVRVASNERIRMASISSHWVSG